MNPKRLQVFSTIIFFAGFFLFIGYNGYHVYKGNILVYKTSEFEKTATNFFPLFGEGVYEFINPADIAFFHLTENRDVKLITQDGQRAVIPLNPRLLKKNFLKGYYQGNKAFANADHIVFFKWDATLQRTYFRFANFSATYYFDDQKPSKIVNQASNTNKEFILPCTYKDYINALYITTCSENQPCGCTYFRGSHIKCSCQHTKVINRKIEEIR